MSIARRLADPACTQCQNFLFSRRKEIQLLRHKSRSAKIHFPRIRLEAIRIGERTGFRYRNSSTLPKPPRSNPPLEIQ